LAAKRLILEENKEIIKAGDNGKTFKNVDEVRIYLRNLLLNYDYYLEGRKSKTYGYMFSSGSLGLIAMAFFFVISVAEFPGHFFSNIAFYTGIASVGIGMGVAALLGKFGLKNDKEELDTYIEKLKIQCGYTKSETEELELMRKIVDDAEEKHSLVDTFISDITRNMTLVARIKYPSFEEDIYALNTLAQDYLKAKEQLSETHEYYILSGSKEWFTKLLEIEARINEKKKIYDNQNANKEELTKTIQMLESQGVALSLDSTEDAMSRERKR